MVHACVQVVGAGRGPLVQASLNAGVTAGRTLKVYAVEKNANAVITLRNRAIMDGWDNVTIVSKDMRQWVSETRHLVGQCMRLLGWMFSHRGQILILDHHGHMIS